MSGKSFLDYDIVEKLSLSSYLVQQKRTKDLKVIKKFKIVDVTETEKLVELIKELNAEIKNNLYLTSFDTCFNACDTLYLVHEYCEGGSLKDLLARAHLYQDSLHESEVLDWFSQTTLALHFIIVTCGKSFKNLTPKKLLLKDNKIKLSTTDIIFNFFGGFISRLTEEDDIEEEEELMIYKKSYTKIENTSNNNENEILWSLGCILYELCTLEKLFPDPSFNNKLLSSTTSSLATNTSTNKLVVLNSLSFVKPTSCSIPSSLLDETPPVNSSTKSEPLTPINTIQSPSSTSLIQANLSKACHFVLQPLKDVFNEMMLTATITSLTQLIGHSLIQDFIIQNDKKHSPQRIDKVDLKQWQLKMPQEDKQTSFKERCETDCDGMGAGRDAGFEEGLTADDVAELLQFL